MIILVQGKKISEGAKALQKELTAKGLSVKRGVYNDFNWGHYIKGMAALGTEKKNNLLVNWGDAHTFGALSSYSSKMQAFNNHMVNLHIDKYSDKKLFFTRMDAANLQNFIPCFWLSRDQANAWLATNPEELLCIRHKTRSSGSNGLEIVSFQDVMQNGELPKAPLYTQYIPKKQEFRCHIMRYGNDIWQQKKLKQGTENPNFKIRNHQGGWIFARENIQVPFAAKAAIEAFKSKFFISWGLDFAGVDIIWNEKQNRAYILEINTAPGLEGQTVKDYAEFLNQYYSTQVNGSPLYVSM